MTLYGSIMAQTDRLTNTRVCENGAHGYDLAMLRCSKVYKLKLCFQHNLGWNQFIYARF